MWTKTLKTNYKGEHQVLLWYDEEYQEGNDENLKKVNIQSMVNEYFLNETIVFETRDAAYDFITNYPVLMAKAFVIREGYNVGAFE